MSFLRSIVTPVQAGAGIHEFQVLTGILQKFSPKLLLEQVNPRRSTGDISSVTGAN